VRARARGCLIRLRGQIPIDPKTNQVLQGTIEQQTRVVMDKLGAVLKAAGVGFEHVVMAHCFLKDLNDFPRFNETYATCFRWLACRATCRSRWLSSR
jgi:2-iminobutanoate/2-iminopropanoate deaminase